MAYTSNSTGLLAELARIQQIKSPEQLTAMAEQYKQDPAGAPLIAAALTQAQKLKELRSGMLASGILASDKAGGEKPPVVDEAIARINPRQLAEDVGIGRLPAPNIANMAEGGIVAFAGGGKSSVGDYEQMIRDEAERQGVDPDLMVRMFGTESAGNPKAVSKKGAAGLGQLMPDTAKEMGLSPDERFIPSKNIPASVGYFKKQLDTFGDPEKAAAAYNWGPGALGKHLQKNPSDWKMGLPKETANYLTSLLPMGSAQAEALPPPTGQFAQAAPADVPSIYTGPGYTPEGLEELGQRLDVIREARSKAKPPTLRERQADPEAAKRYQALQDLNLQSQREYEKYAENIYNKPAFAAPSAGGKGVGTTTLPAAQAVAKEAAARDIAAQEARRAGAEPYAGTLRSGIQAEDKQGAAGFDQPPEELPMSEKKMIGLAKDAIPASERKGWTDDMLMQFFLSMMAGQSPNALANIGTAGLSALKYGQEAKKAEYEQRKAEQEIALGKAHEKYYGAAAQRYAAEDKPLAQYTKAVDNALAQLEKNQMYAMASPAQQAAMEQQARQRVLATYSKAYPELADTILGKTGNPLVDKYLQ